MDPRTQALESLRARARSARGAMPDEEREGVLISIGLGDMDAETENDEGIENYGGHMRGGPSPYAGYDFQPDPDAEVHNDLFPELRKPMRR